MIKITKNKDGSAAVSGSGDATQFGKVITQIQKALDAKAKSGEIADGTQFAIEIDWKKKTFKRRFTAHKQYPVELPRGPAKRDK